ncbi:MAG: PGF-CTERM sorting domain-containing protein, partial [Methanophagales archaeon]|nr:PGF-CTERM sorting domain-containing protein [Methanophagales archaeon]
AEVKIDTTGADDRTYTIYVYYKPVKDDGDLLNISNATASYKTKGNYWEFVNDSDIDRDETEDYEDEDIQVREPTVTFDIPRSVIIGEDVDIIGTISAGDYVDILIDEGRLWYKHKEPVDENNEFDVTWRTMGITAGSYTIEVYIDRYDITKNATDGQDAYRELQNNGIDEDGKTSIRLAVPGLDVKQLRNVVAEDDDYEIEGTATGVDNVDLVLIGPKGYTGKERYEVQYGLDVDSISVSESNEFSEETMMIEDLDTGIWKAIVLSPGRDGVYGVTNIEDGDFDDFFPDIINPEGKDQKQLIAMILDVTIDEAGSDDLVEIFTFKVESPYVRLNPIESVPAGEPLNITGTTNREPESIITFSTLIGPEGVELSGDAAIVEWPTAEEGVFTTTIDTTGAKEGPYTLEADDGDGNTDTIEVTIGPEAPPTPTPTGNETTTPTPTPEVTTPTPTPEVTTPTPTGNETTTPTTTPGGRIPGFESVVAIAGLLAVAYLVLSRRRE